MAATALVLLVPESERLVQSWRSRFDPVAAQGMPAHVTVLFPFKDEADIDAECLTCLGRIFERLPSLTLAFECLQRFPNALWLAPDRPQLVKAMTRSVVSAYPDYPPYGGAFPDSMPHLTVAQGDTAILDEVEAGLMSQGMQTVLSKIDACSLFAKRDERWRETARFPFASG